MFIKKNGVVREIDDSLKDKYIDKGYTVVNIKNNAEKSAVKLFEEEIEKLKDMSLEELKNLAKDKGINIGNLADPVRIIEKIQKASS